MISMTTKHVLELFQKLWKGYESGSMKIDELTSTVLSRADMWGFDLNTIPGFTAVDSRISAKDRHRWHGRGPATIVIMIEFCLAEVQCGERRQAA